VPHKEARDLVKERERELISLLVKERERERALLGTMIHNGGT
jgi:hypothetical protein